MRKIPLMILSIILSSVLITAHLFFVCRTKLDNICLAAQTASGSVLASDNGTEIRFLKMTRDSIDRAESSISYKKIFEDQNGEPGYNFPLDISENNGKIYLLNEKSFFSERASEYEIILLDFKRKKTESVFAFTEKELGERINKVLGSENEYSLCGNTFDINNDGITLYLAEQVSKYRDLNSVYKCRLTGSGINSLEKFSEYRTDQIRDIMIAGDKAVQLDANYRLIINGENTGESRYSMLCRPDKSDEGFLIARDLEDNEFHRLDLADGTVTELPEMNLDHCDIADFYTVSSGSSKGLAAVCYDGENNFLYDVSTALRIDRIYTENTLKTVVHSLLILIASFAAVWLVGALIYVLRAAGRVSVKFAAAVIPVMLACNLIAYSLVSFGMHAIEEHIFKNSLMTISAQYNSLHITDGIGGYGDEYREETVRFIQILADSEYLKSVYWTEDRAVSADVNFYGYIKDTGTFVSATDIIEKNYDADTLRRLPSKTSEKMRQAAETGLDMYCSIYDGCIERVLLISPTRFAGDNSVNGVFLFSVSSAEVRYSTDRLLDRLMSYDLILSLVISLLFTLSAVFPLRGLKKLQKKSADYLSGVYVPALSVKKKHEGCVNETDIISDRFDELLNNVCSDFNEIDNLRKANAAYFSDVILKIFNKKTINSVKFGESATVRAYCVRAVLPEKKYSGFNAMNKLLNALAKSLKENNAFAVDIDDTSISVYSLEPGALNVLFFLRGYDSGIKAAADRCYIDIGIVNIGGSMRFNILREDEKRYEILMNTLKNTGSLTAVTHAALEGRGGLSAVCIGMADNEFIYEISGGIPEHFADDLRTGIERYFHGDRAGAREKFVAILKARQNDPVARYYINLLDDNKTDEFEENLQ